MSRILTAGLALGFGLVGGLPAADANALYSRRPCESCGVAGTTRIYKTIHPLLTVTRYHDRSVYHHVTRLHYVVAVTRIQPIIHVEDVTRLHHFTIVQDAYADQPRDPVFVPYVQQQVALPTVRYDYGYGCYCGVGQ